VKVAVTQQDSMFKSISLPGGISSKATEYKELAAKGDKWESPVFSIGSGRESSDLPKVSPITRKHHDVRQGGLRDMNGSTSAGSNPQHGCAGNSNGGISPKAPGANRSTLNGNSYTNREKHQGFHGDLSSVIG